MDAITRLCGHAAPTKRRRRGIQNGRQRNVSAQILLFLTLITLFNFSGDQCCDHGKIRCCNGVHVSAGAVEAAKVDEEKEKKPNVAIETDTARSVRGKPKSRNLFGTTKEAESSHQDAVFLRNETKPQATFSEILKKAGKSGIGGGIPGAVAGVAQVLALMWMRTVMNYQCRYGASFPQALRILYNEGGIPRFYRGLSFALVQAPLARFVSTAANDGVETLLANLDFSKNWGPGRSTIIASIVVGMWRMLLMPIDTCKTVLQVDSVEGFRNLMRKVKVGKFYVLYQGAFANAASAIAAHYPWFYTYKVLSRSKLLQRLVETNLLRNAITGFISSVVSDTFSNAIRVVKVTKQSIASKHTVSYKEVIAMILAADGWKGLFGRGLRTRILGNAVQSVMFTVIWRGLADRNKTQSTASEDHRKLKGAHSEDTSEPTTPSTGSVAEDDGIPMEEGN